MLPSSEKRWRQADGSPAAGVCASGPCYLPAPGVTQSILFSWCVEELHTWPGFHTASRCPSANTRPQSPGHDGTPPFLPQDPRSLEAPSASISDLLLGDFWMPLLTTSSAHKTEKMSLPLLPRYIVSPAPIYACHLSHQNGMRGRGRFPENCWPLVQILVIGFYLPSCTFNKGFPHSHVLSAFTARETGSTRTPVNFPTFHLNQQFWS